MKYLITAGIFMAASTMCFAQWDLISQFSTTDNGANSWSYGRESTLGGAFTLNATEGSFSGVFDGWLGDGTAGSPFVGQNSTNSTYYGIQPFEIAMIPDSSAAASPFAVVRWTAQSDATIGLEYYFGAGDIGAVSEYIQLNNSNILSIVNTTTDNYSGIRLFVHKGDVIDTIVGPGTSGDATNGATPVDITIDAVPEPSSIFALGLGVIGLAVAARIRRA